MEQLGEKRNRRKPTRSVRIVAYGTALYVERNQLCNKVSTLHSGIEPTIYCDSTKENIMFLWILPYVY